MTRLGLLARARKGRRMPYEDTSSARAYCTGQDSRHTLITDDGFTAWGSRCECFKERLLAALKENI